MAYFTLVAKEDGKWSIVFGDYERETVEFEIDDVRSTMERVNGTKPAKSDLKILRTASARKSEIDAAVAKLNERNAA